MDESITPREHPLDALAATIAEARQLPIPAAVGREAFGIRPHFDHVLVLRPELGAKERNGLWIPDVGQSQNEATVLAVGPGRHHEGVFVPVGVRVGDKVILAQAAYHPIAVSVTKANEDGILMKGTLNLLLVKEGLIIATVAADTELLNAQPKKMYGYGHDGFDDGP